ncbi:MAG TPA: DUF1850 domain-containing protein [Spirochaetales bacterium]|nr:DUF1850 domain-containing protein [Spirochaetales bacterium]
MDERHGGPVLGIMEFFKRLVMVSLLLLAGVSCTTAQSYSGQTSEFELTIRNRDGVLLEAVPVPDGRFDLVYIHSFHLTPVVERYEIRVDDKNVPVLHLFELEYESCGVGMPTEQELGYRLVDGKFELSMDRTFVSIPLMISIVEGHGICVGNEYLPFTKWLPPESMLILAARKPENHAKIGEP